MTEVHPTTTLRTVSREQLRPDTAAEADTLGKDALVEKLDALLERYLNTLDSYQKAQQQLTAHLSSGYLSTAQANFNNPSGLRYGQDYYDERMEALRKITIKDEEPSIVLSCSVANTQSSTAPEKEDTLSADSSEMETLAGNAANSATTAHQQEVNNASTSAKTSPKDPLRWFGILVPPALRQAQSSFIAAVEGPIPQIATITKDLRQQEIDIGRLRKQIRKL